MQEKLCGSCVTRLLAQHAVKPGSTCFTAPQQRVVTFRLFPKILPALGLRGSGMAAEREVLEYLARTTACVASQL